MLPTKNAGGSAPADSMSDSGNAPGASPRELEIRAEVEALLTKLYLPRYAAVLDPVLFSLLSAAMAQNMGAIEDRFELEADKRGLQVPSATEMNMADSPNQRAR